MTDEKIERVAKLIAEKEHMTALTWNLAEIGQSDKLDDWLKLYPIKVTPYHRELAGEIVAALASP